MKVLKFGGSSVATPESLLKVKNIICGQKEPVIVVVSALGGVTDSLIRTAKTAESSDDACAFRLIVNEIRKRHLDMCRAVAAPEALPRLIEEVEGLSDILANICEGVYMLKVLPAKALNEILSFGERISSRILCAAIPGAELYDSLDFIKTTKQRGGDIADPETSYKLIRESFKDYESKEQTAIVPGFISSSLNSGEITNLGRGGSDYTASLIAAALDAESLEIWTDVDGFMTADPRIISTSYVIDEMSYAEAMELCNFGAKVVYPPTLYAVCKKNIPIIIKNTFNPESKGTTIHDKSSDGNERAIKGISSIDDICLISLTGTSMVGIVGIDSRLFTALTKENISAFLVSQAASETGISIGVSKYDAELAAAVLNEEFSHEIETGAIAPVSLQRDLAAVAVVGDKMRKKAGVAGKLFSTLGRSGISVTALAQSATESNISFIIEREQLRKAINVIHDSFFLSEYQELNLFICGIGTVGGSLISQIEHQREKLMRERNLKLNIVGIARSTKGIFNRQGIELSSYKEQLSEEGMELNPELLKEEIFKMNIFNPVFVDCTASPEIAAIYEDLFKHGVSVVTANKIAASSQYENYRSLKECALNHSVKFLFETNVGAGLPIINTINALCNSGDKILKMEAVLSGTLNFIFNTISADIPFSKTVRMAKELGFSEPDPRIDLSGKDVIRKLVILSREAGYKLNQEDVEAKLFIPDELFKCSMEEFWEKLPSLDEQFEKQRRELEKDGKRWRFVAKMEDGKYSVSLRTVDSLHSFYVLDGSNNIILLTTERYNAHPMLIQGYGAGAEVTAAGVFADIMSIANI